MDAFYASVEQRDHPEWKGRPVIVGADPKRGAGRGVVAACSYEARAFGVHSALPIGQAWRRCPEAVYVRPRLARYEQVSREIMAVFGHYTDRIEPLGLDEAFLDVTGSTASMGPPESIARDIQRRIRAETGLEASVGVACNKFLAKVASDLEKPAGRVVVPPDGVEAFLGPLPIEKLWGVGPRTAARLRRLGVGTIGELAAMPPAALDDAVGSAGTRLRELARGVDSRPVVVDRTPRSVSRETTFSQDTTDRDRLIASIRRLADSVAARLRGKRRRARTIVLKLRRASFETSTRQVSLPEPTDDGDAIFEQARLLFDGFGREAPVRLLGVSARNLVDTGRSAPQLGLFERKAPDTGRIGSALDEIHARFGDAAVRRASELT